MTFIDDQAKLEAEGRRSSFGTYATVEVGHSSTRRGIVVRLDGVASTQQVRAILATAFDRAAGVGVRQVTDPGWWALMVGWAGASAHESLWSTSASIQRVRAPGAVHCVLRVERSSMLEPFPLWPMARLRSGGRWLDLRGERALAIGPADVELVEYATGAGIDLRPVELRRMFEMGVLEWGPAPADGLRREVVATRA